MSYAARHRYGVGPHARSYRRGTSCGGHARAEAGTDARRAGRRALNSQGGRVVAHAAAAVPDLQDGASALPAEVRGGRRDRNSSRGGGTIPPASRAIADLASASSRAAACRRARSAPRRWGAPWPGVRCSGGADTEVREGLVDHRRLRDERDDPHHALAGGTREGVDLDALLEQRRPPAAGAAVSRPPRGRLADQPSYRVVTWPGSGMCPSTRARNSSGAAVSVPDVGPSDLSDRYVTAFAARSYVTRSSATGLRAQDRASRVANARSSSGTRRGPPTRRYARGSRSAAT